jgi:ankyrin repeat protein
LAALGLNPNEGDYDRRTALHLAASEGQLEVTKVLIEELKVDPNPIDRWEATPLANAVQHNHADVADYLRKVGAIEVHGSEDEMAGELIKAASEGNDRRVAELLRRVALRAAQTG